MYVVGALLLATYCLTLAPTVTLWDAGEFQAAIGSLGIPHPPGTPLYIFVARAWGTLLGFLPLALAVNLLSATCTAVACALLGNLMARWTASRVAGIAAGIAAGTMLAVWQNATETEVYAASLLLAVLMVVVGEKAGRDDSPRHRLLLAFLMALAVPLQISALVAAPAAIYLAASVPGRAGPDGRRLFSLGAVFVLVTGAGLVSGWLVGAGLVMLAVAIARPGAGRIEPLQYAGVAVLGLTATLFLLVRAAHDPLVNQGNPDTVQRFLDVIARRQYAVPGLWPRRAPPWIQGLNLVQYADWQVASGLDASVAASWRRTPWTVAALALAVGGARWLGRADRRAWWGTGLLLGAASLGIVVVLNLNAGPSILDSVLPAGARHEPRERDYFFALAFAVAGALAGAGAVAAAGRWRLAPRLAAGAGLAAACLPLLLNWRAADRRPEAMGAATWSEALLASAPRNAVLLVAGDNDSYTVWYRQAVLGERLDVVPVTIPLLGAGWYREELRRRHRLFAPGDGEPAWRGEEGTLRALVTAAVANGRPLAASVSVSPQLRHALAPAWALGGLAFIALATPGPAGDQVDPVATRRVADLIASRPVSPYGGRDPANSYALRLLACPRDALRLVPDDSASARGPLLDSRCNFK